MLPFPRQFIGTTPRKRTNMPKWGPVKNVNAASRCLASFLLHSVIVSVILQASSAVEHPTIEGLRLNEFVHHFEPAFFSLDHVVAQHHQRRKRSISGQPGPIGGSPDIKFNFTAHNRLFQLELHHGSHGIFADDITFENSQGPIDYALDKVYSGVLRDTPEAQVHGVLTEDGHFDGHISTPSEHYYIEPAHRYFSSTQRGSSSSSLSDDEDAPIGFHSVIYKASDVHHPTSNPAMPCKSHELHLRNKEDTRAYLRPEDWPHLSSFKSDNAVIKNDSRRKRQARSKRDTTIQEFENLAESDTIQDGMPKMIRDRVDEYLASTFKGPAPAKQTITTYEVLDWADVPESVRHHFRKRAKTLAANKKIDPKKTTCMLYLQADHLFYEKMGSEEATIDVMTRHVQRVNSIYKEIDFDQDGKPDNISFMIKRIKVHTGEALKDPKYRFPGNYGVEKFLEIFSEENYDAFCLAYMFTYRDFEGGTLGLAWTGDLKNAGGVCERNGHYRGSLKSLNTGIITLLNYGKHVPPAVSHVTLAHEMGHNFGSPHDPENNKVCVPGGEDGNYIMFARATSGDKKNNRQFSPCSLKSVKNVLTIKARGRAGCFAEPKQALCGNGVVEEGEECDCGWEEDCEEECCWPQSTNPRPDQTPCTLRPEKVCSPTQGPCCTNECTFKIGDKCRDDNGCREESFCAGIASICPYSELKPNKTVCNKEFVCYKGECTGSICLAYGMESCQCSQGPEDAPTKACELCCKEPGHGQACLSSFELNDAPYDVPDMFAKPGTPCNKYQGYCDVFQMCREVDPSGPLATLRKFFTSKEFLASVKAFLLSYWYAAVFILIAICGLVILIIRFGAKKSPRSKRRRRHGTVHHDVETSGPLTVALPPEDEGQVQVHPMTIEASVPMGKKVRKGEKRKKSSKSASESKGRKKSSPTQQRGGPPVKAGHKVDGAVSRATQLAANLSQLIVNLPSDLSGHDDPYKHKRQKSSGLTQYAPGKSSPSKDDDENVSDSDEEHEEDSAEEQEDAEEMGSTSATLNSPESSGNKQKSSSPKKKKKVVGGGGGSRDHWHKRARSQSGHKRASKSLSPEKSGRRISRAATQILAGSMTSISKSMEKLDLIGQRRRRERRAAKKSASATRTSSGDAQKGRKKSEHPSEAGGKEVTIAKVGRFKFSLEVKKQGQASDKGGSPLDDLLVSRRKNGQHINNKRKGPGGQHGHDDDAGPSPANAERATRKKKSGAGHNDTTTNGGSFEPLLETSSPSSDPTSKDQRRKKQAEPNNKDQHATKSPLETLPVPDGATILQDSANHYGRSVSVDNAKPHPVIVSKKHRPDRPLQQRKVSLPSGHHGPGKKSSLASAATGSMPKRSSSTALFPNQIEDEETLLSASSSNDLRVLDYRLDFPSAAPKLPTHQKKFARSVSTPGPGPTDFDDLAISRPKPVKRVSPMSPNRKYSFANDKRPDLEKLYQLRRSASTIGEEDIVSNQHLGRAASKSLLLTPSPTEEVARSRKSSAPPGVPSLEAGSCLSSLKKHLQAHWDQDSSHYEAMPHSPPLAENSEDESDVSSIDSKQRLSPPTQVQSLSEDSSSVNSSSKVQSPTEFDLSSGSSSSDEEIPVVQSTKGSGAGAKKDIISRKRILAAVAGAAAASHHAAGGKRGSIPEAHSRAHLITSSSNTSSSCGSISSSSRSSLLVDDEASATDDTRAQERRAKSMEPASMEYLKNYGEVPRLMEEAHQERKKSQNEPKE